MNVSLPHRYSLRSYQVPAWKYMQGNEEGKRAVCIWHRRAGKDLFAINMIATKVFERVGTYWHLLPTYRQGRAIERAQVPDDVTATVLFLLSRGSGYVTGQVLPINGGFVMN